MNYLTKILILLIFFNANPGSEYIINTLLQDNNNQTQNENNIKLKNNKQDSSFNINNNQNNKTNDLKKNSPDETLLKIGINYYNSKLYHKALQIFENLQKEYNDSPYYDSASLWKAKIFIKLHQYSKAIKQLNAISDNSGEYPASLFLKGKIYDIQNDFNKALEFYQKVAMIYPEQDFADDALILSAQTYIKLKKGILALELLLDLIKKYPDRETIDDAYYWVGKLLIIDPELKDLELSKRVFQIFLKKAMDNKPYFKNSPLIKKVQYEIKTIDNIYLSK